jgi:DNA-binding transcriptional LysR family regulator
VLRAAIGDRCDRHVDPLAAVGTTTCFLLLIGLFLIGATRSSTPPQTDRTPEFPANARTRSRSVGRTPMLSVSCYSQVIVFFYRAIAMQNRVPTMLDRVPHRMKLQHLKVVLAVAEWGSMARAAKHLAISQPVVSKVVADLEDMLGVRLFDRTPQGVEPTLYGQALLRRSVALFDDLKTSVDEVRFLADPTAGELQFGATEPLLSGIGTAVINRLSRQYPRIVFRPMEADSATLITRDLPERRIAFAIVPLPNAAIGEDFEATVLFHDRLRVIVGGKSRWAARRGITLADLAGEPWCVAPSAVGSLIGEAFHASGLKGPHIAVETTIANLNLQLVESGRFVGHFGESLLHFYGDRFDIRKLPIDLPIPSYTIAAVTLKNRTISPVARLFIDCARDISKPLALRRSRAAR